MQAKYAFAVAAAALLLAAGPVLAQMPDPNPAAVQPGAYRLDPNHARILFSLNHRGFSTWYGDFSGLKGAAKLDPKTPANNSVEVTFPTASVTTTNAEVDSELKSSMWFDAAKFPTATFKSTKVVFTGPGKADVIGDFTFHGVTKPVTLKATFLASGINVINKQYTVGFDAVAVLKRSDYGVTFQLPFIGDEITVHISAPFEKAPG